MLNFSQRAIVNLLCSMFISSALGAMEMSVHKAPWPFIKVARQNGLIALDNVLEFHNNMEHHKVALPAQLVTSLVDAVGTRSISDVQTIIGNIYACPYPFNTTLNQNTAKADFAKQKLLTFLLSLNRNNYHLPTEITYKIVSYCPEIICNKQVFADVLPYSVEQGNLDEFIINCPLDWFISYLQIKQNRAHVNHFKNYISLCATALRSNTIVSLLPESMRTQFDEEKQNQILVALLHEFKKLLLF